MFHGELISPFTIHRKKIGISHFTKNVIPCHEITQSVGDFFYHGHFSCDGCECNRVGKLFNTITLLMCKKITNKNTGKPYHPLRDCHLLIKTVQYLNITELAFGTSFFSTKTQPIQWIFFCKFYSS